MRTTHHYVSTAHVHRARGETHAMRISRGFTLIELLVVVSVIALLISILLPSLAGARQQAKATVCLANLKRIGLQNSLYVNDYGVYPPVRLKNTFYSDTAESYYHPTGHEFRRKAPRWQWFLSGDLGPPIDPRKYQSEEEFNASMVIDNDFWEDPAMRAFTNDIRNGAYGYNGTYLGNTRDDGTRWMRFPVSESMVRAASGTVFVADSRGGLARHGDHSYWLDPPKRAKYGDPNAQEQKFSPNPSKPREALGHSPVELRHRGRGNVVFCDGHAAGMTLKDLGYHVDGAGTVVPVAEIDREIADNRLWMGTGRDDP